MAGGKPTVYLNGFDNYSVNVLRPQNTESVKPELNDIGVKYLDKNELMLHNSLNDAR